VLASAALSRKQVVGTAGVAVTSDGKTLAAKTHVPLLLKNGQPQRSSRCEVHVAAVKLGLCRQHVLHSSSPPQVHSSAPKRSQKERHRSATGVDASPSQRPPLLQTVSTGLAGIGSASDWHWGRPCASASHKASDRHSVSKANARKQICRERPAHSIAARRAHNHTPKHRRAYTHAPGRTWLSVCK
jgi:hypothetical protein